jgi:hypothetical protein
VDGDDKGLAGWTQPERCGLNSLPPTKKTPNSPERLPFFLLSEPSTISQPTFLPTALSLKACLPSIARRLSFSSFITIFSFEF